MDIARIVHGAAVACVLALAASGCSTASRSPSVPASSGARPNTAGATSQTTAPTSKTALAPTRPGPVTKVLVFVAENHSVSEMKSEMPYTFGLARRFGYAPHHTPFRHPPRPNYIAFPGAKPYAITNDAAPPPTPVAEPPVSG